MDTQLFLAPASKNTSGNKAYQHLENAVLNGVPPDFYSQYTDSSYGNPARIWGLKSSIEPSWEGIQEGDWLLIYTDKDTYRYAAQVQGKEHNPELGEAIRTEILELHEKEQEHDWDYLVFLDDPVKIDVEGKEIAELFGFGNNFPVRFMRVMPERMGKLEDKFASADLFIESVRDND